MGKGWQFVTLQVQPGDPLCCGCCPATEQRALLPLVRSQPAVCKVTFLRISPDENDPAKASFLVLL